jgi:hypothetical protein
VITYPMDVKVIAREGLQDPSEVGWSMRTDGGAVLPAADGIPTEPDDEPARLADIRGTIAELQTYAEGESASVLLRILVEGVGTDDTLYDKAWVEIVAATQISFDGESFAPPTLGDLTPGRQVSVIFIGPVRESYPVQAVAGQVMIYRLGCGAGDGLPSVAALAVGDLRQLHGADLVFRTAGKLVGGVADEQVRP